MSPAGPCERTCRAPRPCGHSSSNWTSGSAACHGGWPPTASPTTSSAGSAPSYGRTDAMPKACLVDVWDTILKPDFEDRLAALTAYAGVDPATFLAEWLTSRTDRDRGKLSVASSFTRTLRACGIDPTPELVSDLLRKDAEFAREHVRPFDDTVP